MKTAFAFSLAVILIGMVWRIHTPHSDHRDAANYQVPR